MLCYESLTKQVCREKFRNSFLDTPYIIFSDKFQNYCLNLTFAIPLSDLRRVLQRFHYKEKEYRQGKGQRRTSREKCIFLGVGSFLVSFFSYRSQNTITGNACSFF